MLATLVNTQAIDMLGARVMFGAELRRARKELDLSQRALARRVNYSYSQISRVESGERRPPEGLARKLDQLFGTGTRFQDLLKSDAGEVDGISPVGLPLALVTGSDGRITFVPTSRRSLMKGALASTALVAAQGGHAQQGIEFVTVGDRKPAEVFRVTLRSLIDQDNVLGAREIVSQVESQVGQIEAALARARGVDAGELRYLQTRFAEFASWLYQDLGDHLAAQDWLNFALGRAHFVDDAQLTAYVLARQAQLGCDMGSASTAVESGTVAVRKSPDKRLRAIGRTYLAHGKALAGSFSECEREYEAAATSLNESERDSVWGSWLDSSYIAVHRAHSLAVLGRFNPAIEGFETALDGLGAEYRRDRGVYLARKALAHAGARDAPSAANAGREAVTIALETGSGRIATDLSAVANLLREENSTASREFIDLLRATAQTN